MKKRMLSLVLVLSLLIGLLPVPQVQAAEPSDLKSLVTRQVDAFIAGLKPEGASEGAAQLLKNSIKGGGDMALTEQDPFGKAIFSSNLFRDALIGLVTEIHKQFAAKSDTAIYLIGTLKWYQNNPLFKFKRYSDASFKASTYLGPLGGEAQAIPYTGQFNNYDDAMTLVVGHSEAYCTVQKAAVLQDSITYSVSLSIWDGFNFSGADYTGDDRELAELITWAGRFLSLGLLTTFDWTVSTELEFTLPNPCLHEGHTTSETIAPTCTSDGYTLNNCSLCGAEFKTDVIPAPGHSFSAWQTVREATCTQKGKQERSCATCGTVEHREISEKGHVFRSETTPPDCENPGFTVYTCTVCAFSEVRDEVPATGHSIVVDAAVAPSCTETGLTEGSHCGTCGKILIPQEVVPALGHTVVIDAAVPATCTETGLTEGSHCDVCGVVFTEQEEIPATGHSYGDWIVVLEPNSTTEGLEESYCHCGDTLSRTISVLENGFLDVKESAYYFEPVLWAAWKGITAGTDATHFSPDNRCTRAQVVTFLWRAVGCPDPTLSESPFVDVKEGAYYYEAVLWAVENGITAGVNAIHFGPEQACTRGQVVTFLWRACGKPEAAAQEHPFADLKETAYYYDAVLWAVENGITAGTGATTFAPNLTCTRGQIVTFLYRDAH